MKSSDVAGRRDVQVDTVPDPVLKNPSDVIVRVTPPSVRSDLHLYETFGPFLTPVTFSGMSRWGSLRRSARGERPEPGDRVVVPFNISCGTCFMCTDGLQSQCETTQVRETRRRCGVVRYTKLYGRCLVGRPSSLRVPSGTRCRSRLPHGPKDQRFLFLSDVLPTAWQALAYADVPMAAAGGVGLGLIGDMATRIARQRGYSGDRGTSCRTSQRARRHGVTTIDLNDHGDDLAEVIP